MKISQTPNPNPNSIHRSLSKPPSGQSLEDRFERGPFAQEVKDRQYAQVAWAMAKGAGVGAVAGAATGLMSALPGVPVGLATGLTTSAGLITGAWLGLAIGYVSC
ncbi:hypothetical protein JST97_06450 [bacterium]|nr:hypothetical protein [bacterium]